MRIIRKTIRTQYGFNATQAGAIASLQMANEIFGMKAATMPIYAQNDVFAYRKEWRGMILEKGLGLPSFWTQLNGWSANPALLGTLRWGWKQGTSNPNPMSYVTRWEGQFNFLLTILWSIFTI